MVAEHARALFQGVAMSQVQAPLSNGRPVPTGMFQSQIERTQQQSWDFEDFFENGGIALHLVGADGTILHANKAELEMLGYSADEYIGRHIAEFHADRPVIEEILDRLGLGEKLEKYPASDW